ncbi:MAG TPA: bifunctional DNA-binding transcriptional regulator/O6-methylguanine-DNA methyltransferase Ada [Thermomicrobiales bacterium]|nr:bifunctional DNA-binding transcriptional regulator/O6-methylguanine-DNA methyltransferase Ada [Thermomicrobiales bacterium]
MTVAQANTHYDTPDSRWQAVLDRDASAVGHFILAVKTTGIYCRPGCPARTPKRENVVFFDTTRQARHAGFRACQRCHPDDPGSDDRHSDLIREACQRIERADRVVPLEELAETAGLSKHHFHRIFKERTGLTPGQYARAHRARRVQDELAASKSITDAMYAAGFQSSGRFYASTSATLGMSPGTFREGGKGEHIQFAIVRTSLGLLLIAATAKGVCSIAFGDEAESLVANLRDQFPRARIQDADPTFEGIVTEVIAQIEQPHSGPEISVDLRGTAFQHRVWNALRAIPLGTTRSYAEVADQIGSPSAVRAVAQACARNDVAVVVPCHRVVRKDGSLAGYRWGTSRKEALLARERQE